MTIENLSIENQLRELIVERYDTVVNFSKIVGIKNSTIASILARGVNNSTVDNIIKICNELQISTDALAEGKIVSCDDRKKSEKTLDQFVSDIKRELSNNDKIILDGSALSTSEKLILLDFLEMGADYIKKTRLRNGKVMPSMKNASPFIYQN